MWTRLSAIAHAHSPGLGCQNAPPGLPVVMVTAFDDKRRRHAAEAGALQFLSKPADFDQSKKSSLNSR